MVGCGCLWFCLSFAVCCWWLFLCSLFLWSVVDVCHFCFFFVLVVVCYLFVIFVSCVMFVARCLFGCFLVLFTVLLLVFGSVYCLLLIFDVSHFFDDCYFLFVVCHVLSVFQVLV